MKKKTGILFSIILLAGGCLYSQETQKISTDTTHQIVGLPPGTRSDSLKTVTVTATRTEKDVMDVGRSVTVISNEQIKQASCNTLAELLSQQEGIFIDGAGQNPGVIQTLSLRGADNYHTTIMIDGVPISDPSNDHNELDLSELSLANVDHIEIVRGSHSTLYGSSAMGGVVNIITNKNYLPGIHADISVTGGEFGANTQLFDENALLNYTFKNGFYVEGAYHRLDDKGLSAAVDTITHPLPYQTNPQNNMDKGDAYAKLGYRNSKWNIYGEYRNTDQKFGLPVGAFEPANNYIGNLQRNFASALISYNINDNFQVKYNVGYSKMTRSYVQDTSLMYYYGYYKSYISNDFKSSSLYNELSANYNYKTSQFIIGGGSNIESMDLNTIYWSGTVGDTTTYLSKTNLDSINPIQRIYYGFAQADINGGTFAPGLKAFSLLLGTRFSSNNLFGNNLSYEINPSCKISPNSMLFISYSTGFNAPSLYQLYGPNDMAGDSISLHNPSLKPETSSSIEFGIKHRVANTFFTVSYFKTVVSNYIDYVYLWNKHTDINSLTYADFLGDTYMNIGSETTQGFEFSINSQVSSQISIAANVSILSSSLSYSASNIDTTHSRGNYVQLFYGGNFLSSTGPGVKSTGLLRRPGDMANISITYKPVSVLSLTASVRYVGSRTDAQFNPTLGPYGADASSSIADYTLLDLFASCKITKHFSTTLRCENVFNETYYEILGYTTRGRSLYLNLRYAF